MDPPERCDVVVVGAGIVGLATARELVQRYPRLDVCVLEREPAVGQGQTGRNSGVVHAGIYYEPGSLKARLCVEGARELYEFCDERGIAAPRVGKLIGAVDESEVGRLDELERRGRANGVPGLRRLDSAGLRELEPHVRGVAALHSPQTGIVDFAAVARALAEDLPAVATSCGVTGVAQVGGRVRLTHARGQVEARAAVFCAGHAADRLAVMCGAPASPRIVPFRGAYARVRGERAELVRGMVYPVPDPRLPFLGVHLTRHPDGELLVGPTALLDPRGLARTLAWPGSWRMFRRWWRTGAAEMRIAFSKRAFARAAQRYVPQLEAGDLEHAWYGVRAQALHRDGRLEDDFVFSEAGRTLHVRNAPSPAATASLAIARLIADRAGNSLGL